MASQSVFKNAFSPNDKKDANPAEKPTLTAQEKTDTLLLCFIALGVEHNTVWLNNLTLTWIFTNIEQIDSGRLTELWNTAANDDSTRNAMNCRLHLLKKKAALIAEANENGR
jgi:hypothetical protein